MEARQTPKTQENLLNIGKTLEGFIMNISARGFGKFRVSMVS